MSNIIPLPNGTTVFVSTSISPETMLVPEPSDSSWVGDKPIKVAFTFNFLDRAKVAKMIDGEILHAQKVAEQLATSGVSAADIATEVEDFQVSYLTKIVAGWGFEEEFNEENLRELVRNWDAIPAAIISTYKGAYQAAREGN